MTKNDDDDKAARIARADAIRAARDRHNAGLSDDTGSDASAAADEHAPNYVDFIDRKMKHPKE